MCLFLLSHGSLNLKIRFFGQEVYPVARSQKHRYTDTKVHTEDILSGFQECFLQTINKDRPNTLTAT